MTKNEKRRQGVKSLQCLHTAAGYKVTVLKSQGAPRHISIHSANCFFSTLARSCSIHQPDSSRRAYVGTNLFLRASECSQRPRLQKRISNLLNGHLSDQQSSFHVNKTEEITVYLSCQFTHPSCQAQILEQIDRNH